MKERILFILAIIFVTIMAVIESRQDYWIITSGATGGMWKLWGNTLCFGWILVGVLTISYFKRSWTIVLWIPILWMIWWIVHDMAIGLFLTGNPFHIGSGSFDQFFGRIFLQSGLFYILVRMFWTILMVLGYTRFAKETVIYEINEYTSNEPIFWHPSQTIIKDSKSETPPSEQ